MSVKFINKCNYFNEACVFLERYFLKEDFDSVRESLIKKSKLSKEEDRILKIMQKVYEEILVNVNVPDNLVNYFTYFDESQISGNIAMAILASAVCSTDLDENGSTAYIKEQFHKNPKVFIDSILNCEDKDDVVWDKKTFMQALDEMDAKDDVKWNIWKVYCNFDKHVDILMEYLIPIISVMKQIYPVYEHEFLDFYNFWEEAGKDGSFYEKINFTTSIQLQDDCELYVMPNWMGCNSVRLITVDEKLENVYLFLGIHFKDAMFHEYHELSCEELYVRLKMLSDPSKYEILQLIKEQRLYGSQLAERLHLSTATISHHVNGLSSIGLINIEKDSNRVYYRLHKDGVKIIIDKLQNDFM